MIYCQFMEATGAEIVVRCLAEEGVEFVFGYPGGAVLNIYDEIFKQDKFKHVLVRHEQAAVHAADAYARSTGRVGVALVTSGPGVTNAVTGIATAYMDSIPIVVVTGQVPTPAIGLDAFQEVDTVGITRPCVKHNFLVKDVKDLAVTMKKAFIIAATGRPGPVVVDVPKDVTAHITEFVYPDTVEMRSYNPVVKGHSGQLKHAAQMLLEAKRPMIYAGGGVVLGNASEQLAELTRLLGFPVTNTLMGLGGYPATDQQFLGMLGMHGTYEANMAMQHCDVLLAVGARFDDRVIGNPTHFAREQRRIIHIDIDPSSIAKRVKVDVPIVGDRAKRPDRVAGPAKQPRKSLMRPHMNAWWTQIECVAREGTACNYNAIQPDHQAAIRGGEAVGSHRGRCLCHLRCRPAPDVGRAVLQVRQAAPLDQLRRPRHHGLRPAGCHGRAACASRGAGGLHHRRGQHPDVHPGAVDLQAVPHCRSRSSR